jgi:outer membrane protein assembly factor BamB
MYDATNPGKPIWNHTSRVNIPRAGKTGVWRPFGGAGAGQVLPLLDEKHIAASWAGNGMGDRPVVTLRTADGGVVNASDPHGPQSRFRYRTIGNPTAADGNIYAAQLQQPYRSIYGHQEYPNWGDMSLSCFDKSSLEHRWTRVYPIAATNMSPSLSCFRAVLPQVSEGALFFCTNDGHVIRTDARDGELEWIHFFRPTTGDRSKPASPRCLGALVVTDDKVICMPKFTGYLFALDKATGRRIWRTPILRGHHVLGVHGKNVVVVAANAVYAVDLDTGKLRWGRSIAPQYTDGFQLPRSQMIGSSIYCGTKNTLYQFDANSGALLESRDWAMGGEVPMSFLVSGSDLYAVSDLPMKDEALEKRLVEYHTVINPAGGPIDRKDGSKLFWRECMLICIKDGKLVWSRFVSNDKAYQSRFSDKDGKISMTWSAGRAGSSAQHDAATGQLISLHRSRAPKAIEIGGK